MTEVDLTQWKNQMTTKIGELDNGGPEAQQLADELRKVVESLQEACESNATLRAGGMRGDVE
jgi:hypothetical protein